MFKIPVIPALFAVALCVAPGARAATTFDPTQSVSGFWVVEESLDSLTITILGQNIIADDLFGTTYMNEEPPFTTFGSDSITVANVGLDATISLISADLPRAPSTCNTAPDESQPGTFGDQTVPAGHCYLDLRLVSGADLFVDIFSPAGDTGDPNFSDSISITVPEPVSIALTGIGLLGLAAVRRRRAG